MLLNFTAYASISITQGNVTDIKTGSLISGKSGNFISSPQTQWVYSYTTQHAIDDETLSVDGWQFKIDPTYNSLGHLSSLSYPSGSLISYAPNALGQAKQAGSYATLATYHPNGLLNGFSYGNGLTYAQSLDAEQRPYQLTAAGSTVKFTYGYDGNNNVTSLADSFDPSYSLSGFVYDGLDRLKNVNGKWGAGSFTYDSLSNIKTQSLGSTSFTYTYSASTNRLSSISGALSKSFGSDGRGNLTQNGTQTLTFNAANEMVNGNGATYLYDAYHRLVKKTVNGVNTYSVYDHSGTLITQYQNGTYTDFIKLGKQTVAEVKGGTVTYQHTDVLGSPIAESTQGQSITRYHYKPFGERIETFSQDDTGYTGHQFDTVLGLTYMQQRYFDQAHPHFTSVDPVQFTPSNVLSFNRYAYANQNPYKYRDPDGRAPRLPGCGCGEAQRRLGIAIDRAANYIIEGWKGLINQATNSEDAPSSDDSGNNSGGDTPATDSGDKDASTPTGSRGSPMDVPKGTNEPTDINGRTYSGHALDQMQGRGVPPSAVEEAIGNGQPGEGNRPGTTTHTDTTNGVKAVTNDKGNVITVITVDKK